MTGEQFVDKIAKIFSPENTKGAKIKIMDLIDQNHLNCLWYGKTVGYIEIDNWIVSIEANGDVRIQGKFEGEEFDIVDKNDGGRVYQELGNKIDDTALERLIGNPEPDNFIEFGNNNWFEFNVITPDGIFIDCFDYDNVLDSDNLLECFDNIDYYIDIINRVKQEMRDDQLL